MGPTEGIGRSVSSALARARWHVPGLASRLAARLRLGRAVAAVAVVVVAAALAASAPGCARRSITAGAGLRSPGGPPGLASGPPGAAARRALLAAATDGEDLALHLRALVGRRAEPPTDVWFALDALRRLGAPLDAEVAALPDAGALVRLAQQRDAAIAAAGAMGASDRDAAGPAEIGDLLVFDRVAGDRPASLVAVVIAADDRGVLEFVYLARGVVRRGWAAPARPDARRDEAGRVLNTILRASDGEIPRGAPTLSGQLLAALIPLDRLLR